MARQSEWRKWLLRNHWEPKRWPSSSRGKPPSGPQRDGGGAKLLILREIILLQSDTISVLWAEAPMSSAPFPTRGRRTPSGTIPA
eukprot:3706577-Amphidinium_carterae.1